MNNNAKTIFVTKIDNYLNIPPSLIFWSFLIFLFLFVFSSEFETQQNSNILPENYESLTIGELLKSSVHRKRMDPVPSTSFNTVATYAVASHLPTVVLTTDIVDDPKDDTNELNDDNVAASKQNEEVQEEQDSTDHDESINEDNTYVHWNLENTYDNQSVLEAFIKKEECWSVRNSLKTLKANKIIYRCNKVKRMAVQCNAQIFVLEKTGNNAVLKWELYRKNSPHNHDALDTKSLKLSENLRNLITQQYDSGKTAKTITYELLSNKKIPLTDKPSYKQVVNEIFKYKKSQYGQQPITMAQITKFVNEHIAIPKEEDEPFIVAFERSPSTQKNNKYFRLFISTQRLLRTASEATVIHADATHKVTTEKLPLLPFGVSDSSKSFHFIGLTLTTHEKIADYTFSFNALQLGVRLVTGKEFTKPLVLVSDADASIHAGFHESFGNLASKVIMCYPHVMGNVKRKYKFADTSNKEQFMADIRILHNSASEQQFDNGCALFIQKWKDTEPNITITINSSFFQKNKNWYIGSIPRVPKTNNPLEAFNSTMKRFQTKHQKQPLKIFKQTALDIVEQRSKEYLKDKQPFAHEVSIPHSVLTKAIELQSKFNFVNRPENSDGTTDFFMFKSTIQTKITLDAVNKFYTQNYKTFDEFTKNAFNIYKITFPKEIAQWKLANCTCPAFDEEYICKHIVAIAYHLNLITRAITSTENYDEQPLFQTKRGRPKQPTSALTIDEK